MFALFAGFVFELFTLRRPDTLFENATISGYLLISALTILLLQFGFSTSTEKRRIIMLTILQFSFGHLASSLMILYAHSGTLAGGLIFIGILAALFFSNELLKNHYARNTFRISMWYFLLLTYMTLVVPIFLKEVGIYPFIVSVIVAFTITAIFVRFLAILSPRAQEEYIRPIRISILIITALFSLLYFTNNMPPVPLALKDIGIYHAVQRQGVEYIFTYEKPKWYQLLRKTSKEYHFKHGEYAYCFTAIFAPKHLKTKIWHRWEYLNEKTNKWETKARVSFPIYGGRSSGYRGYTRTAQLQNGKWRCSVETTKGALLGRTVFTAVEISNTQKLPQDKL